MDWICLAEDRDKWRALINMLTNYFYLGGSVYRHVFQHINNLAHYCIK
jgi:hypothetical protein